MLIYDPFHFLGRYAKCSQIACHSTGNLSPGNNFVLSQICEIGLFLQIVDSLKYALMIPELNERLFLKQ